MDPDESASEADTKDESDRFPCVTAVATEWMFDFTFISLCRYFKEGKHDEFSDTVSTFTAISQSKSLKRAVHQEKTWICAFLARVMNGKDPNVLFEEDESVMPLMSAANVWSELKNTVEDESLFTSITVLLLVQSVAVSLEKGYKSAASSALKWFKTHHDFPWKLGEKLSTIVTQMETYHPFLMTFSFKRLVETIQSFLDSYLKKNPSDYLLKAATKAVQSSRDTESLEDMVSHEETSSETYNEPVRMNKKSKRKLFSNNMTDVWKPDTVKKSCVSIRRLSRHALSQMLSGRSPQMPVIQKKRKTPKKWTPKLDQYLKQGVKRHGHGKWALILQDYDFEGRTGTMLKDRWRTLLKTHEVD